MSKSSLSSVVSNLVRASMGSSLSDDIADEDLDRHVAELILKEAKQKGERYNTDGIRAYLNSNGMSDSNAPKTNKRFLSSIIRSTDDHNKTILRAQALAAQEVKREREERERRERRARAEEAAAAERTRRLGRSRKRESDRWHREDAGRKRKRRSWEIRDGHPDPDDPSNDREAELRRRLKARYKAEDDAEQKISVGRSRSRGRSPAPDPQLKRRRISPQPGSSSSRTARSPSSMSRSPSPPSRSPSHTPQLPSKMDKYFEKSYDPRLDVAPLPSVPKVPSTGLIDNAEFEGWDAMLELIRMRREDKEEKKRLERLGFGKDTEKKDKKGKGIDVGSINDRWRNGGEDIMEIAYKKRGSVREWDMGKEGF